MGFRSTFAIVAVIAGVLGLWFVSESSLKGQSTQTADTAGEVAIYSPAHSSIAEAASHFLGLRGEPRQPIAFVHQVHVETVELECADCHISVSRGPQASIPDIRTCWGCHSGTLTEHPEIRKMKDYYDKGQDIPWQRVWGWVEESHVRFNHAPHIRAEIECTTCHGDVSEMTVATRAVEHTMNFCVSCHRERKAPDDCLTCHY